MSVEFETVIGLEVHVQLSTASKIFCGASAAFGGDPNEHIDPLTFGLPGSLPVLNKRAVEFAIMLGLATKSEIRRQNRFARKHYFYPDLPKGYQISQYEEPICEHGSLEVPMGESSRIIGITRIHMEEDAGKNIHDGRTNASLVDLNRAGVPLLEVVSEPDLRSPAEAAAYLKTIRQIVRYLRISDGNMEEGSLRCDANISLRPKGQLAFGTRSEIKNMNSFRFVERALEYEVARQMALLKQGGTVVQETRLFDSVTGTTKAMRSKEESAEYRYFPDPDLPPLEIEESWIRSIEQKMPLLPQDYKRQLVDELDLSMYDAEVLTSERDNIDYFSEVFSVCKNAKAACNWVTSELFGLLNKEGKTISDSPITAQHLGRLVQLIEDDTISGKMGKLVFEEMFQQGGDPETIIAAKGLKQITDDSAIQAFVKKAFDENPSQAKDYCEGKDRLHGFFVGQVMKLSAGNANPKMVNECIEKERKARSAT
jgi:aspartyl-tRNA(Asn)/glutamyl-tRNA(Gln) amidotransferase subunit B